MQKRAPTLGNILVIVLFALSCFGLLLFLWESFGGAAAVEAEGLPHGRRLPARAGARRTVRRADLGRRRRPRGLAETRQGRSHPCDARNREPVRAAALEHARDPAPEDAAGGDLRAADPGGQRNSPLPARRRQARREPGRTVGDARRHPLRARPEDAPRLPGMAAVRGARDQRAGRRNQRRLRRARTVRRTRQQVGHACSPPRKGR